MSDFDERRESEGDDVGDGYGDGLVDGVLRARITCASSRASARWHPNVMASARECSIDRASLFRASSAVNKRKCLHSQDSILLLQVELDTVHTCYRGTVLIVYCVTRKRGSSSTSVSPAITLVSNHRISTAIYWYSPTSTVGHADIHDEQAPARRSPGKQHDDEEVVGAQRGRERIPPPEPSIWRLLPRAVWARRTHRRRHR